jgi:hypothetical protein
VAGLITRCLMMADHIDNWRAIMQKDTIAQLGQDIREWNDHRRQMSNSDTAATATEWANSDDDAAALLQRVAEMPALSLNSESQADQEPEDPRPKCPECGCRGTVLLTRKQTARPTIDSEWDTYDHALECSECDYEYEEYPDELDDAIYNLLSIGEARECGSCGKQLPDDECLRCPACGNPTVEGDLVGFMVFCRESNNQGTTWVGYVEAPEGTGIDAIRAAAVTDCAADWESISPEYITCIGVTTVHEGDTILLHWEDL